MRNKVTIILILLFCLHCNCTRNCNSTGPYISDSVVCLKVVGEFIETEGQDLQYYILNDRTKSIMYLQIIIKDSIFFKINKAGNIVECHIMDRNKIVRKNCPTLEQDKLWSSYKKKVHKYVFQGIISVINEKEGMYIETSCSDSLFEELQLNGKYVDTKYVPSRKGLTEEVNKGIYDTMIYAHGYFYRGFSKSDTSDLAILRQRFSMRAVSNDLFLYRELTGFPFRISKFCLE